jgi:hypothetical protein
MNRSHCAFGARVAIALITLSGCAGAPPAKDPAAEAAAKPADNSSIASADPSTTTPHLPLRSDASVPRAFGWVSVAVGAQAAVIAITTSFMMLYENGVRSDECNSQKICSPRGIDANSRIDALAGWNAASWAVAVVGIGAGAYLILSNPPESQKTTAIGVGPDGSGMGLNLRSTF